MARGTRDVEDGFVQVLDEQSDRQRARVALRFGGMADTWLARSEGGIAAHCTCRPDLVGRVCRHLWSSLAAARDRGVLAGLADRSTELLAGLSWSLLDEPPDGDWQDPLPEPPPCDEPAPPAARIAAREAHPYVRLLAARSGHGVAVLAGVRYGEQPVSFAMAGNPALDEAGWFWRDAELERCAVQKLVALGLELPAWLARFGARQGRWPGDAGAPAPLDAMEELPVSQLAAGKTEHLVEQLLDDGWIVEGETGRYRRGTSMQLGVEGRDGSFWLSGEGRFGELGLDATRLLAAIRQRRKFVRLGDGDIGVLPSEWLSRWGLVAEAAPPSPAEQGRIPLTETRARCVRAILEAADPHAALGVAFPLDAGEAPPEAEPVPAFAGSLRRYQRRGLGWLQQLRAKALGGALCDEMGLGKTVQVLAHLADLRAVSTPALVVAPTSLVANWAREASRFVPQLRFLEHCGPRRSKHPEALRRVDLVLTSYATLLRDLELLAAIPFDLVVLDEAQAIKNPRSRTARAVRRLHARQRLALTGTPLENHMADLWSLCEFLNPGMIPWRVFRRLLRPEHGGAKLLAQLLRPLLLRRTKAQVAPELPPRVEHRVFLTLPAAHQQAYGELREHYRKEFERAEGDAKGAVLLEGLLRLRQLACHPGLLDPRRAFETSPKLGFLFDRLLSLGDSDRKALVFSQFTALLGLVRDRLRASGIAFAYLDGSTRDRASQVGRFQEDPGCRVFLVSLKAGGTGLNLTAADDVFILDPWWNPAAEAQAIDRAHRIGRSKPVVAWKLVVRDTVEERVVELQDRKREMADALFDAELRGLTREELLALM